MKRLAILLCAFAAICCAADQVPVNLRGRHPADPERIKVGGFACAYPLHVSAERHVWIFRFGFYYDDTCVFKIQKTPSAWKVYLGGVKLITGSLTSDEDLSRLGAIRISEIVP